MREIKFKIWKDMEMIFLSSALSNGDVFLMNGNSLMPDTEKIKIMQYTGLKDKNGIEIYEGDIIRVNKLAYDKNNEFEPFVSKIEFYMGSFHLDVKKMLLLPYGKDIEVIGNIYENPELLIDELKGK